MTKTLFGQGPDGVDVYEYTLDNGNGLQVSFLDLGANVHKIIVPDKDGNLADVVLGYDDAASYLGNDPFYGCCVVPNANRIGDAKFTLNGTVYELDKNDGENNLHSGFDPIPKKMWKVETVTDTSITFSYDKKHMQNKLPGNMKITVTYTLTDDNGLRIDYSGLSDADTLFNPTNHSYFNLAGQGTGSVLDELVWIDSDEVTAPDDHMIPHGDLLSVAGTPFDFNTEHALADHVGDVFDILQSANGYDHNYVLKTTPGTPSLVASLYDPKSGRFMEVLTDRPGVQLYTANFLNPEETGKDGNHYAPRDGVCFETQCPANSINVDSFPDTVTKAGVETKTTTIYRFSVR